MTTRLHPRGRRLHGGSLCAQTERSGGGRPYRVDVNNSGEEELDRSCCC